MPLSFAHLPHMGLLMGQKLSNLVPPEFRLCRTPISQTTGCIYSMEWSRLAVVQRHNHLPICPLWTCRWTKNLSNLVPTGSKFCGMYIIETTAQIFSIWSSLELSWPGVVQRHGNQNTCLWNSSTDFLSSKFYGVVPTCNCAASYNLPIWSM